jgi:hypothetical protein
MGGILQRDQFYLFSQYRKYKHAKDSNTGIITHSKVVNFGSLGKDILKI